MDFPRDVYSDRECVSAFEGLNTRIFEELGLLTLGVCCHKRFPSNDPAEVVEIKSSFVRTRVQLLGA
jgi:hypothetical protein